jgi:HK97 family phage major capsid protein
MSTVIELIEQSQKLFKDAAAILTNPEADAEKKAHVPQMLEDAKAIKAQAMQLKEIEAALDEGRTLQRKSEERRPDEARQNEQPGNFKNLGEFWSAVAMAGNIRHKDRPVDRRLKRINDREPANHSGSSGWYDESKVTLQGGVGAYGGFLVPIEQESQLYAVDAMVTPVRARATSIPMRRRQVNIPVLDQTNTTAGTPAWFGGITATWTEEGGTKNQSDPTFRQIELVAHKLVCYSRTTDELLDDSAVGLDAFFRGPMGFGGTIQWYTEYAFLQGTGAGQPLGIINAGCTISQAATASPPAPGSLYNDLVAMLEQFLPGSTGVWMINQRHMSDLLTMNGPSANPSYIWGNATSGAPGTLLGYPVIFTEKLPAPGTAGSILLADLRYYLIGDRQATTVESTNLERFQNDETSWRAVHRVDGQPWLSTALTLADGTAQVSPFVILGAKTT